MMDLGTAYKQHQQIQQHQRDLEETEAEIKTLDATFKVFFFATFVLYFLFVWTLYIADVWGFTTWIVENASEVVALIVYALLALSLPYGMAQLKESCYRHFSKYRNKLALSLPIIILLGLSGVIYEAFVSSGQQQKIATNAAENSKSFDVIASAATPTLSTGPVLTNSHLTEKIAQQQQKVAQCEQKLARGKEKHCEGDKARLQALIAADERATSSAAKIAEANQRAQIEGIRVKAEALKELHEDSYKPAFQSLKSAFSISIASAVMMLVLFLSLIFEMSHALLILLLYQKRVLKESLEQAIIGLEAAYLNSTGKKFCPEDFTDDSVLNMQDVRESNNQMGFGQPAIAQFKYQEPQRQPVGFVQTDARAKTPAPATNPPTPATSAKLGTHDEQLEMPGLSAPEISTYNRELSGHGIDSPNDEALNKADDKTTIQRIINKGLSTTKPQGKAPEEPPGKVVPETTSKPPAGTLPKTTREPPAGGLYGRWVASVRSGECRPSVDATWKWIQKRTASRESGKSSFHRTHISTMQKGFFSRALHDGLMKLNPNFKRGGKKYIWIGGTTT